MPNHKISCDLKLAAIRLYGKISYPSEDILDCVSSSRRSIQLGADDRLERRCYLFASEGFPVGRGKVGVSFRFGSIALGSEAVLGITI